MTDVRDGLRFCALLIAVCCASSTPSTAQQYKAQGQLWRMALASGVSIQIIVSAPQKKAPRATLVLLPGGDGRLKMGLSGKPTRLRGNFLVRSQKALRKFGFATALLDAPSDRQKKPGLLAGYRATNQHAVRDIGPVVEHLKAIFKAPVFLVGTSRGTVSAVNAARRIGDKLAGVALMAAITQPNRYGATVNAINLGAIAIPTLFVHHVDDHCAVTPAHGARIGFEVMQKAGARVRWATVSGGRDGVHTCSGRSYHGFWKAEGQALGHLNTWISKILSGTKS